MRHFILTFLIGLALSPLTTSWAAENQDLIVNMYQVAQTGVGESVGTVTIQQTKYGLLFIPNLHGLAPGVHGFHIHENPVCTEMGMAAGGHYDPTKTGKHLGPYDDKGHKGDLPVLIVDQSGQATLPVLAPRLKLSELKEHSLMIHEGGDNYSDEPQKLGGGGGRMVCGIIK